MMQKDSFVKSVKERVLDTMQNNLAIQFLSLSEMKITLKKSVVKGVFGMIL